MKQILITVILIFSFSKLPAQDTCKYNKPGLAIQLGAGVLYGFLGGLVEYQIILKEKVRITPLAGMGFSTGGAYPTDTINMEGTWLNYAIGFNIEYGKKHRLIVGPQVIGANYISKERPNESINKRMFVGSSFIVGYKGTASFGLIWQLYVGVAHMQKPLMNDMKYFFEPNVGLGIGYKF